MKLSIRINQILFFAIMTILSSSCIPDDDMDMDDGDSNVEYFVKAKVDGVAVEYKNEAALDGSIWTNEGLYNLDMSGGRLEGGQYSESITINLIKQSSQITETNYSGYGVSEGVLKGVLIIYSFDIQDIVYGTDITNPVSSLNVTEITQSHIKGTFSGVVRDVLTDDMKTISDGEFFVPRSQ